MSRTKRYFPESDQRAFLAQAAELRRALIQAMAKAPIDAPFYRSLGDLCEAIDGVAEAVTGDRAYLHAEPHTAR